MPLTAKAKNILLIIQNLIFLKLDILAKTPWVGATPPPQTAGHMNQPLWCHLVKATQQTRDVDTMLA